RGMKPGWRLSSAGLARSGSFMPLDAALNSSTSTPWRSIFARLAFIKAIWALDLKGIRSSALLWTGRNRRLWCCHRMAKHSRRRYSRASERHHNARTSGSARTSGTAAVVAAKSCTCYSSEMLLFDTMADEVLQRAGLSKQGNEEAHREVASILAASMAHLSAAQ